MTASRLVTIFCDAPGCGQWWDAGVADTATRARQQLRNTRWKLNVVGNGPFRLDYCPDHADNEGVPADDQ
jgi:hypothetical protein